MRQAVRALMNDVSGPCSVTPVRVTGVLQSERAEQMAPAAAVPLRQRAPVVELEGVPKRYPMSSPTTASIW